MRYSMLHSRMMSVYYKRKSKQTKFFACWYTSEGPKKQFSKGSIIWRKKKPARFAGQVYGLIQLRRDLCGERASSLLIDSPLFLAFILLKKRDLKRMCHPIHNRKRKRKTRFFLLFSIDVR